jgi:uncharacterized protein
MKIQPDIISAQSIAACGPGWVRIGLETLKHSVVVGSQGERFDWDCRCMEDIQAEHFAQLAELNPELVIFGSGNKLRFPQAASLQSLISKQIGIETMDSQAACRTYNILAGEGRHVVLALLLEKQTA